jgi:hypothetical protein
VAISFIVAGLIATPMRGMLEFPFTSTLRLPRVFNLGKPSALAVIGPTASVGYRFPGATAARGLRYVYGGPGNVKVVGDPRATGVTTQMVSAVRASTMAEARTEVAAIAQRVYSSDGVDCIVTDELSSTQPPGENTSCDVLFVVPAAGNVVIDVHSGMVQVCGVQGDVTVKTGFGQIDISGCGGKIEASTGWGDIRIGPSSKSVTAATDFGTIRCEISGLTGESRLATKVGRVRCTVASSISAEIMAQAHGTISTDIPSASRSKLGSVRSMRAQLASGGPTLRLESEFGDIAVFVGR